jgi:hypothetical protein
MLGAKDRLRPRRTKLPETIGFKDPLIRGHFRQFPRYAVTILKLQDTARPCIQQRSNPQNDEENSRESHTTHQHIYTGWRPSVPTRDSRYATPPTRSRSA